MSYIAPTLANKFSSNHSKILLIGIVCINITDNFSAAGITGKIDGKETVSQLDKYQRFDLFEIEDLLSLDSTNILMNFRRPL